MDEAFWLLVAVVVLAVVFDYINGFHDTANAIATVVSTNVLAPRTAILMAGVANFVGAFVAVGGVASTIGSDIADPTSVTQTVVASALLGAILWNLITWWAGIPSSSSHALVGGLIGAVLCHRVFDEGRAVRETAAELLSSRGFTKVIQGLVLSPLAGFTAGLLLMIVLLWLVRRSSPVRVNHRFRKLQLISSGMMAFSHGSNDAQKAMGIVTMALLGYSAAHHDAARNLGLDLEAWNTRHQLVVPVWVIVLCASAMGLGTAGGGWRIMKTMGHKIIKLRPIDGFAAETAGALVILTATHLHAPVSTTHVIASSVMGVGASKRVSAVRWGIAGNILMAWVLTIPITALVAGLVYLGLRPLLGS